MLLKLIETFVPEPLILMHPSRYFPKWFPSQGDKHLTPLLLPFNESGSFEHLEVLGHGVQSRVERLCDIQKSSRPVCEPANNCAPSRVRNGCQHVCQSI